VNLPASSCVSAPCEPIHGGYHGTNTSLGSDGRDRTHRSLAGCLRFLRTARNDHVALIEQNGGHRKLASQGRQYDERPLFGLELGQR
jgi:hypothetical protein